jgi:hypothetical protein
MPTTRGLLRVRNNDAEPLLDEGPFPCVASIITDRPTASR